jgi:hypothetical protein
LEVLMIDNNIMCKGRSSYQEIPGSNPGQDCGIVLLAQR